jgi:hypothetical protein
MRDSDCLAARSSHREAHSIGLDPCAWRPDVMTAFAAVMASITSTA